jgi:hypothetical protein
MFGDEETTEDQKAQKEKEDQQLAVIRKEAKAIADTNEAIHAKVPAMNDAPAQVRIAIYGLEIPGPNATPKDKIRYCQNMVSRIPSLSRDEGWEVRRTFTDILDQSRSQGREDIVEERLDALIFRINELVAIADPKATQGLTGISALITQDRRETLNQTIRQQPLAVNSPGIVEGLRALVSGRRT